MTKIQREKTAVLSVSVPKGLRGYLAKYTQRNDVTASYVVKEALKGYLFLRDLEEIRKTFRPLAKKLKIKTDEDVERIFG